VNDGNDVAGVDMTEREETFLGMVDAAVRSIPAPFAERLASVAIVVDDEPSASQLASVEASGLFGLYQGVPRTAYGAENAALASKITIFRGPLERRYRDADALARAVEDTVIHEVAHHFGISDARIRELQRAARR
jgi:predicted Zn-dependent protease with MMP-like domain